jgi:hypothetical protein
MRHAVRRPRRRKLIDPDAAIVASSRLALGPCAIARLDVAHC